MCCCEIFVFVNRFLTLGHKLDEEQVAMGNYVFNKCAEQDSPIHTIQTVTVYLPVGGQLDHNFVRKCRSHSANVSKSASLAKCRSWRDKFYDISIGPPVEQVNWEGSMKELNDTQFGEFPEASQCTTNIVLCGPGCCRQ